MTESDHYPRTPMSKALIDLKVEARPGIRAEELEQVACEPFDEYRPLPPEYSYKLRARIRTVISGEPLPYVIDDVAR